MLLDSNYLGLNLRSPIILASSGLTDNPDKIIKAFECGAGAVVIKSLFEEQIVANIHSNKYHEIKDYHNSFEFAEKIGNDQIMDNYISLIKTVKSQAEHPLIASINCVSSEVWYYFSLKLEDAGVDALELNISIPPLAEYTSYESLIANYINIIEKVISNVSLPVSIKLPPYFPNYKLLIDAFQEIGVSSVVMFNRLYAPDIDIEKLELLSESHLSSSSEIGNSLRWIALLSDSAKLGISAATGIHTSSDIIKLLLAGADSVQICSAIYLKGYDYIAILNDEIAAWMKKKGFNSINEFKGLIAKEHKYTADFERMQYMIRNKY